MMSIYVPQIIAECRCPAFLACKKAMRGEMLPIDGAHGNYSFILTWVAK